MYTGKTSQIHDTDEAEDNDDDDIKERFINASLWVTVVVTLFISLAVGVASTLITLYNIHHSTIQTVFMIQSLCIWYSTAGKYFFLFLNPETVGDDLL